MNPQEQEEMDHFPRSELQNAYTLSQLERKPDDSDQIAELISMGRWCVVVEYAVYCHRTDAVLGTDKILIGDYDNPDEAQIASIEHSDCSVVGPKPKFTPSPVILKDNEIPF